MNTNLTAPTAPAPSANPSRGECHLLNDTHLDTGYAGTVAPPPHAAVIELSVRNHPGAMSHITGLFARRAFNLEAILCVPVGDGSTSTMLLLVADEPRLEQVERQLEKLCDVLSVTHRPDIPPEFFREKLRGLAG